MSAITGIIHFNDEPIPIEHGNGLMQALQKFPADDIQTWRKDNVFLGCHAQWITPESVGEQLPFYDYQRQLAITADAIIDNREELFERLQVHREDRKKITDSQLILLAYHKWGEESPKYLVGDFAFMIWDEKEKQLFGARDFSGGRTLYYYRNEMKLAFSTIIKPLFTLPYIQRALNEEWLAEFLAISSVIDTVDTSITVNKNIMQIPPSHSITIKQNKVKLSRYCTLVKGEELKLKTDRDYVEAFQTIFQEAINSRVRTFRQVGSHLSGGLDSGTVVSFAAKALRKENKQLHTFSYIPPKDFVDFTPKNKLADESEYMRSTAKYVGNIYENYLEFENGNPFLEINEFLETMEMPYKFFENSVWLRGIFETAQKQNIGVLLNGGRGNLTISWGPALEHYAILLRKFKFLRLHRELRQYSKNIGVRQSRILPYIGKFAFPIFHRISPLFESNSSILVNPELAKKTKVYEKLKSHGINLGSSLPNLFAEREKHFQELYPWSATNTLGTKFSLKYSLWKRDPTNDIRVIRFCLSVPEEQYVQNGLDRALVRRATETFLPDHVRLNQRKRGVQGVDWVHRMAPSWSLFRKELQQLMNDQEVFRYLNPQIVKPAISKIGEEPRIDYAINSDYRISIRSLIVYRFIKNYI